MMEISDPKTFRESLKKVIDHYKKSLGKLRSGHADIALVKTLEVKYYGSKMQLYQIAAIKTPEPRLIEINPYNKADLKTILIAIQESNLNLNPIETNNIIRITIAPLTTEQKKIVIKEAKLQAEQTKIAIRNTRRKAINEIDDDETLPENLKKSQKDNIQKIVKEFNDKVEELLKQKVTKLDV